jgi:repressor LexA
LPNELAPGKESFVLKVKGDSMIDAGILDGDLVVVHRQDTAQNGDIVCALINGEATLKKYLKKGDTITLKAENKNYPPIRVSGGEFRILGKLGTLIRKF